MELWTQHLIVALIALAAFAYVVRSFIGTLFGDKSCGGCAGCKIKNLFRKKSGKGSGSGLPYFH